jgi:hypothetical protein
MSAQIEIMKAKIKGEMDKVMDRFVKGNLPPQNLTNPSEIVAIAAGLGYVDFEEKEGKILISTKGNISVHWNGKRFICHMDAKAMKK